VPQLSPTLPRVTSTTTIVVVATGDHPTGDGLIDEGALARDSLWVEGEHIPGARIREVFQTPPDVPARPLRSALLVGSRGAGKTTFLRHLERIHDGISLKLSLSADLASISQELPMGFLAVDLEQDEERAIVGKTVALAASRLAERAIRQGVEVHVDLLMDAIPAGLVRRPRTLNASSARTVRTAVDRADTDQFDALSRGRVLQQFASDLGEACQEQNRGPLLLIIDRGDNVVPACLGGVFQLLDQSDVYTAVAAMRPGPSPPPALVDTPASASAGDHYDVFTLGARPRAAPWLRFVRQSLAAQPQLADVLARIPTDLLDGILALSRDSVRTAISVLGRVRNASSDESDHDAALDGLHNVASNLHLSATKLLRQFHSDPDAMIRELRKEFRARGGTPGAPLVLDISSPRQSSLLQTTSDVDRVIAVGLRCGAFCLPDGASWAPGNRPLNVEVNPLIIWRREDGLPQDSSVPVEVSKKSGDLLGGGGRKASNTVFCAYRMQRPRSIELVGKLTRQVRRHPALLAANVSVTNGQTAPGQTWAKAIRNRISKAKAVVADVTDMRPDVIFEAGFAYGHSKPIIPAVETSLASSAVPRWLTDRQTAIYTERSGMNGIITGLVTILGDPRAARRGPPKPAPGVVVWLRTLSWNLDALEQVRGICRREGMALEIYRSPEDRGLEGPAPQDTDELPVEEMIEKAARAHLLIVSLDGSQGDDLMHYVAGAVAAKPKTGSDGAARRVLVIAKPGLTLDGVVADSLARVTEVVRPIDQAQIHPEVTKLAEAYRKWAGAD